jgi:hypothetical protein
MNITFIGCGLRGGQNSRPKQMPTFFAQVLAHKVCGPSCERPGITKTGGRYRLNPGEN